MKFTKKHKTLFYVPGMISLVLIPVLCLWFIKSNRYIGRDQALYFQISDTVKSIRFHHKDAPWEFPNVSYLPERVFKTISFDGKNDERKLKDLNVPLKKMVTQNDTVNGIKLHFGKHCNYQTFISAQDLLFINKVGSYFAYKNDIYILESPKKKSGLKSIGHLYMCRVDDTYWLEQEEIRQRELFIQNAKRFWQLPTVLCGIILLNFFALIKFNRNRIYNQKSYI